MNEILIGDAVIHRAQVHEDVMTVYDINERRTVASCNWVVPGTTVMHKRDVPICDLIRLRRKKAN